MVAASLTPCEWNLVREQKGMRPKKVEKRAADPGQDCKVAASSTSKAKKVRRAAGGAIQELTPPGKEHSTKSFTRCVGLNRVRPAPRRRASGKSRAAAARPLARPPAARPPLPPWPPPRSRRSRRCRTTASSSTEEDRRRRRRPSPWRRVGTRLMARAIRRSGGGRRASPPRRTRLLSGWWRAAAPGRTGPQVRVTLISGDMHAFQLVLT